MQSRKSEVLLIVTLGLSLSYVPCALAQAGAGLPIYQDPHQPVEQRVEDLLRRMTLKEKVGQLNLPCVYVDQLGKTIPEKMAACKRFASGTYTDEIGPGCGFFTLADTILHEGPRQQAEYFNELQKIALTETRLKNSRSSKTKRARTAPCFRAGPSFRKVSPSAAPLTGTW